jgi:hypothetical protein
MHRFLKTILGDVRGESHHIVAVVADIRGFSQFSKSSDSVDVATYVSKIYLKLIEKFSVVAEDFFFKTTGDGMLMAFRMEEKSLQQTFRAIVAQCLECHEEFATILGDTPLINFETPTSIGFGISRGAACALTSVKDDQKYVIDFSGHKLNLAARLQDIARPSGIVIEGSNDVDLLEPKLRQRFRSKNVYIRSVAEAIPTKVWILDVVEVPSANLQPISAEWTTQTWTFTRAEFRNLDEDVVFTLKKGTVIERSLTVLLYRPAPYFRGKSRKWARMSRGKDFELEYDGAEPTLVLHTGRRDYKEFASKLRARDSLTVEAKYQLIAASQTQISR